ncbi:hypothetical protein [Parasitella parasitica]|uniref:Uncharacterized protein n=1 Tax=Parasitella parasitica TaxID=35722 RepID=A0A0B7MXV2_9FUNG|nr:hypothetical protein [Parasitella parasitica]
MKPTRSTENAKRSPRSYRRNNNPSRGLKVVDAYRQTEPSTSSNAAETSSNARLTTPSSEISGNTEASVNSTTSKMEVELCIASLQSEGLRESTDYCDTCRFKFTINSEYLYTVGPPEIVVAFFTEFVFQRVTAKQISLNTDANVQIALITEETSILSATLTQMLEEALAKTIRLRLRLT